MSSRLAALLRLGLAALLVPLAAGAGTGQEWRFRVYLDEREIGHHHISLIRDGAQSRLLSRAEFDVTLLSIPLFSYRHEATELWDSDCLQRIVSTTDENGTEYHVQGAVQGAAFRLTTHAGDRVLPACISSFAYWDRDFLNRDRLLDPQTGEYLDIEVRYLGEQTIPVRGRETRAHHYRLDTETSAIELWYSHQDHWLSLESSVDDGRRLRYVMD
jgi:hypothetical protein